LYAGQLDRIVDGAEKELASRGHHFQSDRLIVSIKTDPTSGDPSIIPKTAPALTPVLETLLEKPKINWRI